MSTKDLRVVQVQDGKQADQHTVNKPSAQAITPTTEKADRRGRFEPQPRREIQYRPPIENMRRDHGRQHWHNYSSDRGYDCYERDQHRYRQSGSHNQDGHTYWQERRTNYERWGNEQDRRWRDENAYLSRRREPNEVWRRSYDRRW